MDSLKCPYAFIDNAHIVSKVNHKVLGLSGDIFGNTAALFGGAALACFKDFFCKRDLFQGLILQKRPGSLLFDATLYIILGIFAFDFASTSYK